MRSSTAVTSELADSALAALKHAYDERKSSDVGDLILSAQESVTRIKQAIIRSSSRTYDQYELPENNSAV
ncbi:MAG: hypothetical protein WCD00_06065 [Desulfuromonadaceae bacterium]